MVGADVTVTPRKELAADASANADRVRVSLTVAVTLAVGVVMTMFTWVDAALAATLTVLGSTPASAATETEMLFSRPGVKVSIGSAATKPITTWYVVIVIAPGTDGDGGAGGGGGRGGDSGEGGGDGSSGHSARIEL